MIRSNREQVPGQPSRQHRQTTRILRKTLSPMRTSAKLFIVLALTFHLPLFASALPPPFEATYKVSKAGITLGNVDISLRYDNGRYLYRKKTISKGLLALFRHDVITETSEGQTDGNQLTMDKYRYLHKNGRKSREDSITLIESNKVRERFKGKDLSYRVPDHALDRASVEIALIRDAPSGKASLSYDVVEKGRSRTLLFKRTSKKTVTTPAGSFECIEYKVRHNSNKRSTILCLAPSLDYLPDAATHVEKGTSLTMRLKKYVIRPTH